MPTKSRPKLSIKIPEAFEHLRYPYRYKVFYGGRGGAKSESIARQLILEALTRKELLILCAREVQDSIADSSKATIESIISSYELWDYFTSTLSEIRCTATKSRFIFKGLKSVSVDNIKSLYGIDICWVEEAAAVSKRSLDMLLPTIRKPGSEIWFSYNPENEDDAVHDMFVAGEPPPNSYVAKVGYEDNPWFSEELRQLSEWMRSRDPDLWAHVYGGQTRRQTKEHIYNNWRVEKFTAPEGTFFRFGADWGYSIDPTCLIRMYVDEENSRLFIDWEAWQIGCEIDCLPALFDTVPESREWPITADSNKPDTISYLKRKGFQIEGAKKGPGSIMEGIEFVQMYDIYVHPRCENVITELKGYKFKVDPHTGKILRVPVDKKNHTMDSLRYGVEGVRHGVDHTWLSVLS